jgi:2-polyprenyl-6-methoxyphenol hydroxylase-like FAD-dependent oxidoreductase
MKKSESYDVVIVGARVAGAATALALARSGMRVLVIDRSAFGSDTLSTHALMRPAVAQLARLGVLDAVVDAKTPRIESTTFYYGDEIQEVAIKARDGVDALYAPRRTILDPALVDAARAAGAEFRFGATLDSLLFEGERVCGLSYRDEASGVHSVRADRVVGADGLRSKTARLVGARIYSQGRSASACLYAHFRGLHHRGYHWYYDRGVAAGVIPSNDGHTCVFVCTTAERFRREISRDVRSGFHRLARQVNPAMAEDIATAETIGGIKGFGGQTGFFRQAFGKGWALVGDAGYFRDPITAHGITDGLRDAHFLARGLLRGGDEALLDYAATRQRLSQRYFEISDEIAGYQWDFPRLKALHLEMAGIMKAEEAALRPKDAAGRRAA